MKKLPGLLGIIAVCNGLAFPAGAFECTVCHSKNPKMVEMHQALRGRGCFGCHKVGERLMGKGRQLDETAATARRLSDPLCTECHRK
ncbi:cytochrome c3 family protein [Geotalea uraniireducens]|nr:cytochrome c3 family protein [Geotalea uraniireducens]